MVVAAARIKVMEVMGFSRQHVVVFVSDAQEYGGEVGNVMSFCWNYMCLWGKKLKKDKENSKQADTPMGRRYSICMVTNCGLAQWQYEDCRAISSSGWKDRCVR